ncbi:MAG: nuclear transport factor 2 family protein [Chitinophagaceae bacterium]|nr:nuclear transport factor 2 family protein [Chitinophagaceae bacterium]
MNANKQTINRFYTAFQQLDYTTMQGCYHPEAVFNDPAFGLLDVNETRAMWEMLCKRAKDFSLVYGNIKILDEEYTTCEWTASYRFSKNNRRMVNRITAHMKFKDGLIIEHTDAFDIYRWCRQALGLPGILFGWSPWMNKKIQKQAKAGLEKFMNS